MKFFVTPKGNQSRDYSGEHFGKLLVLRYLRTEYSEGSARAEANHFFECQCECGNICTKNVRCLKISTQCPACGFAIKNAKLSVPRKKPN